MTEQNNLQNYDFAEVCKDLLDFCGEKKIHNDICGPTMAL